ncbi:adenylate cyclase [Actinosynnema sp. NPDC020468]|uniref:adenylate cyclase n=1 Tax=Actinosynnema sp. NPDC020468 TaxID=3154488 RepID=UPI0033F6DEB1
MLTRDDALSRIGSARTATALFGPRTDDPERQREARRLFRGLATALHPDHVGAHDDEAADATSALTRLFDQWRRGGVELRTAKGRYRVDAPHAVGSVANVYLTSAGHAVKIVRKPAANPLLHAEQRALAALTAFTDRNRWLRPYYPRVVDTSGPADREFTVFEALADGFVTLADVRRAYPDGLDGRDYAWMHRRLLRAVAGAHRVGLVHGAIVPENVLVHPRQHGIVLVGWSFAVERDQRLLATSAAFRDAYPPEVLDRQPVTAALDVHMAHGVMLDMLAQNEKRQRRFALGCRQRDPDRRPDAVDLLDEYDALLHDLYGDREFRPFAVPRNGE